MATSRRESDRIEIPLLLESDGRSGLVPFLVPPVVAKARIVDPDKVLDAEIERRRSSLFAVHRQLQTLSKDLHSTIANPPTLFPPVLEGTFHNMDGTAAAGVGVTMLRPAGVEDAAWPTPTTVTDSRGRFALRLPRIAIPEGKARLRVSNGRWKELVLLRRADVASGNTGLIVLAARFEPDSSLLDRLEESLPAPPEDVDENPEDFAEPPKAVTLGEGDCAISFRSNAGAIDRFRYSTLVRLVAPRIGPAPAPTIPARPNVKDLNLPVRWMLKHPALGTSAVAAASGDGDFEFMDRTAIDEPIDVSGFHDDATFNPGQVPKAATLGLGYVLTFRQTWQPAGHSLGDLIYSLALAPGEEQQIAIFEHDESLDVRDEETLAATERRTYGETADSSTSAVFTSALEQEAYGYSHLHTTSKTGGVGGAGGIGGFVGPVLVGVGIGGGYGTNTSTGSSEVSESSSRDFASRASQDFHSTLSRSASVRRNASRTGVRLAESSDLRSTSTRRVSNQNHCHALTFQYWQVLRHYRVVSEIDDAQLVCFVPLELIPFAQEDQPDYCVSLPDTVDRTAALERYRMILRYYDVLWRRVRRRPQFRRGLRALRELAADPTMEIETPSTAQNVVNFTVRGTFIPEVEDVSVTVTTRGGGRLGPFLLSSVGSTEPINLFDFTSQDAMFQALQARRVGEVSLRMGTTIPLPRHVGRDDVLRFDLHRRFRRLRGELSFPALANSVLESIIESLIAATRYDISPAELEENIGGPQVWAVEAKLQGGETYVDAFPTRDERVLMMRTLPLTARRLPPMLPWERVLDIESVYQHVAKNTVEYSQAVWSALTPEERAMLLEPYTIGVPEGGVDSVEQDIPLLNCVSNRVLGFFGNSMVMPFFIPPVLADELKMTSRDLQVALLSFHRNAFRPPQTSITLPTRGFLAEAVLGSCNACEKIDLTRFWNYKDSPITDSPLGLPTNVLRGQRLVGTTGAAAPDALAALGQGTLINNIVSKAPTADANVIAKLLEKDAATTTGAPDGISGLDTSKAVAQASLAAADSARASAIKAGQDLATNAMDAAHKAMRVQAGLPATPPSAADKEKADKADAEKKKAEEEKQKAAETAKAAAVKKLVDNAASIAAILGRTGVTATAEAEAKKVVEENGLTKLDAASLGQLAAAYGPASGDGAATKLGKAALLEALGIKLAEPTAAEKRASGVAALIKDSANYASFAGRKTDAADAILEATGVLNALEISEPSELTFPQKAQLAAAFAIAASDTDQVKRGKTAFVGALLL